MKHFLPISSEILWPSKSAQTLTIKLHTKKVEVIVSRKIGDLGVLPSWATKQEICHWKDALDFCCHTPQGLSSPHRYSQRSPI